MRNFILDNCLCSQRFQKIKNNGNTNTTNINSKAKEKIMNNCAIKWSLLPFKWGVSLLHGLTSSIISEIFWICTYLYVHLYMRKFQQIKFLTFKILLLYGSLNNIVFCCLFSTFIKMDLHCMYFSCLTSFVQFYAYSSFVLLLIAVTHSFAL